MISKRNNAQIFAACLATMYASLAVVTVRWLVPHIARPILVFFLGIWIGFYRTGIWVFVERPAELDKKFPPSQRELEAGKKRFFDWQRPR